MALPLVTPREQLERALDIVSRFSRYLWLVLAISVLGGGLSVGLALLRPHEYESETVLLYRELISQATLSGRETQGGGGSILTGRYKEMLMARSNLAEIVKQQNLYPELQKKDDLAAAAEDLRTKITFRDKGSGTFRIAYKGKTPEQAQKVTEALAIMLTQQDAKIRLDQAKTTQDFLASEKEKAGLELKEKERVLAGFLTQHPEFAEENQGGAGASIRAAQKRDDSSGNSTLSALERARSRIVARLKNPNAPVLAPEGVPPPEKLAAQEEVRRAEKAVDDARAEEAQKSQEYTAKHPDVVAAKSRLVEATKRLERAKAAVLAIQDLPATVLPVLSNNKEALEKQLADIEREIATVRNKNSGPKDTKSTLADRLVSAETEWSGLVRDAEDARERVASLSSKSFTADITASSETTMAEPLTVIDKANRPITPAGKPRKLVAMVGCMLFGSIAVALALGLALVDDRILRRRDLEGLGKAPVLAVIPADKNLRKGKQRG